MGFIGNKQTWRFRGQLFYQAQVGDPSLRSFIWKPSRVPGSILALYVSRSSGTSVAQRRRPRRPHLGQRLRSSAPYGSRPTQWFGSLRVLRGRPPSHVTVAFGPAFRDGSLPFFCTDARERHVGWRTFQTPPMQSPTVRPMRISLTTDDGSARPLTAAKSLGAAMAFVMAVPRLPRIPSRTRACASYAMRKTKHVREGAPGSIPL